MLHSIGIQLLGSPRTMLNHRPIISTDTPEERKSLPERSRKPRRAELPEDGQSKERVGPGGGGGMETPGWEPEGSVSRGGQSARDEQPSAFGGTHTSRLEKLSFNNAVTNVILEEWKLSFIPHLLTSHGNT
jgi:hypothetical protein